MRKKKMRQDRIIFAALMALLIIHLAPVVMAALNSLRTNEEVRGALLGLPNAPHFENYVHVFKTGQYLKSYLVNLVIGFGSITLVVLLITLAAYGITKMKAWGGGFFTGYFTAGLAIPSFGILIPLFFTYTRLGLVNTLTGLILLFTATSIPFNFMFLRAFFLGIPVDIEEAARIDGASEWQTLWHITMPLAKPILLTISLIVFTNTWNNFMFPRIFLTTDKYSTVAMNFYKYEGQFVSDLAYIFTAAMLAILPILVLYLFLQQSFIEGMTKGGIKG
jgi:raffinose/stachyose/melibiose transport system permease protein